jgi:hypothetical protein
MKAGTYSRLVGAYRRLSEEWQSIRKPCGVAEIDAELQAADAAFDAARRHVQNAVARAKEAAREGAS